MLADGFHEVQTTRQISTSCTSLELPQHHPPPPAYPVAAHIPPMKPSLLGEFPSACKDGWVLEP